MPAVASWLRLTTVEGSAVRDSSMSSVGKGGSVGAAWHGRPLFLSQGFETAFRFQITGPVAGGGIPTLAPSGGGLAFIIQSDARGQHAHGCAGGGLGFRADPNPYANCSQLIRHALAVGLHADRVEVERTDLDLATPLAASYFPL